MLTPLTQVLLAVPPNPPVGRTLGDIAEGRRAGAIPPDASVQLAPGGPWLSVDTALASMRGASVPTSSSTGGVLALVAVLLILGVVGFAALVGSFRSDAEADRERAAKQAQEEEAEPPKLKSCIADCRTGPYVTHGDTSEDTKERCRRMCKGDPNAWTKP